MSQMIQHYQTSLVIQNDTQTGENKLCQAQRLIGEWVKSHESRRFRESGRDKSASFLIDGNFQRRAYYSSKFASPRAADISEKVREAYAAGRFWPDPLIQIIPNYRKGGNIADLAAQSGTRPITRTRSSRRPRTPSTRRWNAGGRSTNRRRRRSERRRRRFRTRRSPCRNATGRRGRGAGQGQAA